MRKKINYVAVLGAGIMGSQIALHFANAGIKTLLLDIPAKEGKDKNKIVNDALKTAINSKPSPVFKKGIEKLITTGNFDEDLDKIEKADWIIEAIIEDIKIKKSLFDKVEKIRKEGTIVTTNTSGIPIKFISEGRSEDFKKHFCGTHFFNPPRYLKLLEIIPTKHTQKEITEFLHEFGEVFLGKTTINCKDTPAFIANRIGIFAIMHVLKVMQELDLSVEEVDKLTGPVIGRPKSATFRTLDIVGLDTLAKVADNLHKAVEDETEKKVFKMPDFLIKMLEKKWYGQKSGQGFYKKVKDKGESEILSLDLKKLDYSKKEKSNFQTLELAKNESDTAKKYQILLNGKDKASAFYQKTFYMLFNYVGHRIPEIADHIYQIDEAVKAGFGWKQGPFELWNMLGTQKIIEKLKLEDFLIPDWIKEMIENKITDFYKTEKGVKKFYHIKTQSYKTVPGTDKLILLNNYKENKTVWSNSGCQIIDIGDGILNVAFDTKMNTIGGEVLEGLNKAIDLAEKDYNGIVIANEGENFSVGANLGLIFMMAAEQDFDEVDFAVRSFQNTLMRLKYCNVPVIAAPHNLTLGGGCEICMQSDAVQAAAETYIGLVEFGAGLIPAGGGTKEMVLRAAGQYQEGDIELNVLKNVFLTIGQAKVATSALEAFDLGFFLERDSYSMNGDHRIKDAKMTAISMANAGYRPPVQREDIKVQGRQALGMFYAGAHGMLAGGYITKYEVEIAKKLAHVMCGGDLAEPSYVSEQYLLDLEREAFLSLCGEKKTLERMESLLKTGKPLRN